MQSFIVTLKNKQEEIERKLENFAKIQKFEIDNFIIYIIHQKKSKIENIFFKYANYNVALIGRIFNKFELFSLAQNLESKHIKYNETEIFFTLFKYLDRSSISLVDVTPQAIWH